MRNAKGFTLVELAIVITIIGLLIGGVLKGQELLENARLTRMQTQYKSYGAAVITFKDIYKAMPGDMLNPSNFIEGCTTAPCNISGNNNGMLDSWGANYENHNFWLHLGHANLVSGVNLNAVWDTSTWSTNAPTPQSALGGPVDATWLDPVSWDARATPPGNYWHGFNSYPRCTLVGKYDVKVDDGKPTTGDVMLHPGALGGAATVYDPNSTEQCTIIMRSGF